jgi:pyridoxamine 5'-phosphate oxidase
VVFWEPPRLAAAGGTSPERTLHEHDLGNDPLIPFIRWLDDATQAGELMPNAMALATASSDGVPSVRMVLLDRLDERGCLFQTNTNSPKAHDLASHARAALTFWWPRLVRQVRVTGPVAMAGREEIQQLFDATPPGIQTMLRACRQSEAIASRAELEQRYAAAVQQAGSPAPMPSDWGGFRVALETVEFWQGRANRLQDRLRFSRNADGGWRLQRLMP